MVDLLEVDMVESLGRETLNVDELAQAKALFYTAGFDRPAFRRKAVEIFEQWQESPRQQTARAAGIAFWMLNEVDRAIELLESVRGATVVKFCLAELLMRRGRYPRAVELAEKAFDGTGGSLAVGLVLLEALRGLVDSERPVKVVAKLARKYPDSPEVQVEQGMLLERAFDYDGAMELYTQVLEAHPEYGRAMFRLAYCMDLRGDEDTAISLYQQVAGQEPAYLNAMINLGILYDDREKYDEAVDCFQTVIRIDPNHARARLFCKDALAAQTMYYDEELEKRQDKRNRVLEIPVTDFELSVRSRNCLEKMQLHTLGDLTRVTEQELLNFKNFGETSLNEIRQMLSSHGLKLGQGIDENEEPQPVQASVTSSRSSEVDVLDKPLDEFALPIRIKRCAEVLGLYTLGELVQKTKAELLNVKNFGQTSLVELEDFLVQFGLSLREHE